MRALVVDDDELDRKLLEIVLGPFAEVDFAESGEDAFDKYIDGIESGSPYELVCLDYSLPGMNGAKTAHLIRKEESYRFGKVPTTTLCVVSGSPEARYEFTSYLGEDPNIFYNTKPFRRIDILAAIGYSKHLSGKYKPVKGTLVDLVA